jgi:hypothetical protein
MDTAISALGTFMANGAHLLAYPHLQDLDSGPNGTRSDPVILARTYDMYRVDLDLVTPGWNLKEHGEWSPENVDSRLQAFFKHLKRGYNEAPKPRQIEVAIVTHDAILKKLLSHSTTREDPNLDVTNCMFNGVHLTQMSTQQVNMWRRMLGIPVG